MSTILLRRASVYLIAAAPSPSTEPKFPCPSTRGYLVDQPPHNITEVINAVVKIIDNKIEDKETSIEDVMQIVKGPDFPTGATILGTRGQNKRFLLCLIKVWNKCNGIFVDVRKHFH